MNFKNNFEPFHSSLGMRGQNFFVFFLPFAWTLFYISMIMRVNAKSSEQRCLHIEDPASVPDLPSIPHS